MRTLLKTAAIAALITGFANTAHAFDIYTGIDKPGMAVETLDKPFHTIQAPLFKSDTRIAVARLDGGRLIPTPHAEEFDWTLLDRRLPQNIELLDAGRVIGYTPEILLTEAESDNKIDEIRMTAAGEGYDYVILYGLQTDSYWGSFGGKALSETGLIVHPDCGSWSSAKAKALLVATHSGEVLGAATANNIEFHIGELADDVERVIAELS